MAYYRIKNFEKYQHSDHKKSMPWTKLWNHIVDDQKFNLMTETSQLLFYKLLSFAARSDNKIVVGRTRNGAVLCPVNARKMTASLKELEENQLIEKISTAPDSVGNRYYKIRQDKIRTAGVKKHTEVGVTEAAVDSTNFETKNLPKSDKVLACWNSKMRNKVSALSARDRVLLSAAVSAHSEDFLISAIDRASKSVFLMRDVGKKSPWPTTFRWFLNNFQAISDGEFDDAQQVREPAIRGTFKDDPGSA